ncbi:MAG: CMP/dCMP deaminase zinc-binding protein [Parcubacteria group bacterium GW2011_GWC1_43_12]|nr:MAG: CMP/dCMP deaminase zinc-binding protein [Parcubacteria group bacterium GW2011_GWB1_42_6]KKS92070.1 MAG: CMP/dCMP deaminase zinc-binding protein [Parcubacteria group bacterium GW2011_GWC1_43_12]
MKNQKSKSRVGKLNGYVRPNWDEYFLGMLDAISKRATCDRGRCAAIIVDSETQTVLTTGYTGSAPGDDHCDDVGHFMVTISWPDGSQSQHCQRTLHAEENAILQAAMDGIKLKDATLYCKMTPCVYCARRIARVGIKRVVVLKKYHADGPTRELFKKCGVELEIIEDAVEEYKNQ